MATARGEPAVSTRPTGPDLAGGYRERQTAAYVELQEAEFAAEPLGYTAARHRREVGAGYFDAITQLITQSEELSAVHGSTEEEQFEEALTG